MAETATVPSYAIDEDDDAERQLDLYMEIHTLKGIISKAYHSRRFDETDMASADWIAGKALELAAGGLL